MRWVAEHASSVVDASLSLKWLLRGHDEPYLDHADRVQADFATGRLSLLAPDCFPFEIGHALTRAVRRERISPANGRAAYQLALDWRIATFTAPHHLTAAWEFSERYGCSFYDATYLALSSAFRLPFIHADQRLHAQLNGSFPREVWIKDYVAVDDRPSQR